eukprot:INCI15706.1.p1 GENE.INCI15706.1~~INCI15706.1.p1  ORF type:complete len:254 (-),score=41.15 INCI15706.1:933-1694(-)
MNTQKSCLPVGAALLALVVVRRWMIRRYFARKRRAAQKHPPRSSGAHSPSLHRPTMQEVGRALEQAVGVDIGGTLAKIVYFVPKTEVPSSPEVDAVNDRAREYILTSNVYGTTGQRDVEQEFFSPALNGTLHFIKFETRRLKGALQMIKEKGLVHSGTHMYGTGGGAVKFQKIFQEMLGVGVQKFDELETLVNGMGFLMYHYPTECYTLRHYRFGESNRMEQVFRTEGPRLVCSCVDVLLVEGPILLVFSSIL